MFNIMFNNVSYHISMHIFAFEMVPWNVVIIVLTVIIENQNISSSTDFY